MSIAVLRVVCWQQHVDQLSDVPCIAGQHRLTLRVLNAGAERSQRRLLDAKVSGQSATSCQALDQARLRLSWYRAPPGNLSGLSLQAQVKLRSPWGMHNPGTFNYRRWLQAQGYRATGYVIDAQLIGHAAPEVVTPTGIHTWPLLRAMTVGERAGVSPDSWALFRDTGTLHLMVVSGLHMGIVVLLLTGGFKLIQRLLPRWQDGAANQLIPGLGALCGIAAYMMITNASPSVVRAGLMAGCGVMLWYGLRRPPWWWLLLLVAAVSISYAPQFVWQPGFWLSYLAVACLLYGTVAAQRQISRSGWVILSQLLLFIGLTPWLGLLVGDVPLISPITNLLAVPLVTVVILPVAMVGMLFWSLDLPGVAMPVLSIADAGMHWLLAWLEISRTWVGRTGFFHTPYVLLASIGFLFAGSLTSRCVLAVGLLAWSTLWAPLPREVPWGQFRVLSLDVGQGNSAVIDTARHRLLIDTGARFPSGFDIAESVVVPVIRRTGRDHLDVVLLSHLDNDHAGGASTIWQRYPHARMIGGESGCPHGEIWRWEGVTFTLLTDKSAKTENDASCTLLVQSSDASAYFSGDIGVASELRLMPLLPRGIDYLLAPHHGSQSSSGSAWVSWLRPQRVVFSAGRDNRYGHPHPEVVARYCKQGSQWWITGEDGLVAWYSVPTRNAGTRWRVAPSPAGCESVLLSHRR